MQPDTLSIRQQQARTHQREHSAPLFLTSSFVFDDAEAAAATFADTQPGNIYTRLGNPNNDELTAKLCALEGAEAGLVTSSGMSAVFLVLAGLLRSGDEVLSSQNLFGSTVNVLTGILPRWGIATRFVPLDDPAAWDAARTPATRLFYLETPSNPSLEIADLAAAAQFCQQHNLVLVVDNCFATPYLQRPLALGAHISVHSTTKWIDGQGRVMGGAVLGSAALIAELKVFARHTGPTASPFNSWVLSKSLETLAVRMDRHCQSALALAQWLEAEFGGRQLLAVRYPFLESHPQCALARAQMTQGGGIITFEVNGGRQGAFRFLNALNMINISANLGDTRSIVTHPASTTHSKLTPEARAAAGVTEGLIRLSVGLEHIDDLKVELAQALGA